MLTGKSLYNSLGYQTYAAFYRGKQRGEIGVRVFSLPGRKGWFAFSDEVTAWLHEQAGKGVAMIK